jgi:hypothetical protein
VGHTVRFYEAFVATLAHFNLKGVDLVEEGEVNASQISRFRQGGNLRIQSVEKIMATLPPEAQVYMLKLLIMNVESQQTHHDKDS